MSQWRHCNKAHSWYSAQNSVQNVYLDFFILWKLPKLCCFVTYLRNDPLLGLDHQKTISLVLDSALTGPLLNIVHIPQFLALNISNVIARQHSQLLCHIIITWIIMPRERLIWCIWLYDRCPICQWWHVNISWCWCLHYTQCPTGVDEGICWLYILCCQWFELRSKLMESIYTILKQEKSCINNSCMLHTQRSNTLCTRAQPMGK